MQTQVQSSERVPQSGELRFAGRVVLAMVVTGGLVFGGPLVWALVETEQLPATDLLRKSTNFFLLGTILGLIHGIPLGIFGRNPDMTVREAASAQTRGLLYALPALALAWSAAGWLATSAGGSRTDAGIAHLVFNSVAWLAALGAVIYTQGLKIRAMRASYARWPERRLGTFLVVATFVALAIELMGHRPEIWGTRLRIDPFTGLVISAVIALWIVGPSVTLALRFFRGRSLEFGFATKRHRARVNILTGLIAGLALSLLALPFHLSPYHLPTVVNGHGFAVGAVDAVSKALFDEVLLRVVLSTAIFALALRWHLRGSSTPMAAAVVGAAILQTLFYLPGVFDLGFRDQLATIAYMAGGVLLPAIVFGTLFWRRGFATALLANASALLLTAALSMSV